MDGPRTDVSDNTKLAYDPQGNLASITNAAGHVTSFTAYDPHGRPLASVDPNGLTTLLTYYARGRVLTRKVGTELTGYSYDGVGQVVKITLPDGSFQTFTYDAAHRLTAVKDNLGNSITYTLDAMGNRIKEEWRDPANLLAQSRSRQFDALNQQAALLGAQNQTMGYGYDANGNLGGVIDPLGNILSLSYDPLNRLVSATNPLNGLTKFNYDANDNLTTITDPLNHGTTYAYDGLGNRTQTVSPDTGATGQGYDAAGNLLSSADAAGRAAAYSYDVLNRRTQSAFTGVTPTGFTYDQGTNGIGRLARMTDPAGTTTWS